MLARRASQPGKHWVFEKLRQLPTPPMKCDAKFVLFAPLVVRNRRLTQFQDPARVAQPKARRAANAIGVEAVS